MENLEEKYKNKYLESGKSLFINAELSYDQVLITASHDARTPDLVAVISGSVSYAGVNFLSLYNSGNVEVTDMSKQGSPIKIKNKAFYQLEFKFTPLGTNDGNYKITHSF